MNLNKVKKKINQARLILWCLLLKCKIFERCGWTPHDRWMARLASGLQQKFKNKSSTTWHWSVLFFALFLEWPMSCKKVVFISHRFNCKVYLNHYVCKFYQNLLENKPTRHKLFSVFRQVLGDIWQIQFQHFITYSKTH